MKKIAIIGSRNFNDKILFWKIIESFVINRFSIVEHLYEGALIAKWSKLEIVSGGCPTGGDKFAKDFVGRIKAKEIRLKEFLANWDKYGKAAGPIRNTEIANYADECIAFWDQKSRGTKDCIDKFLKLKKPILVVPL